VLVPQPLYLADLAPAEFFLTTLKSILKGRQFESVEEIKQNSLGVIYKKWIKVL
jgi:hypothetical protein